MKNKDFLKLVEDVRDNIIINNYNSCSYVSKLRLNDCINFYKTTKNEKEAAYYFNEIKRLLRDFNLNLLIEFQDVKK